ncbi:hypothetical protein GS399_03160 [Pedobacter sp. HMF7647]|uniref:Uncharacterized protein n=1 Tax=Hufsiella arboris TaxID=2695275 RepID=A0A7K1Y5V1_9SPHI|nr:hypothetical protein [Hufsiella arboris]MXV49957.1 hypothetical protein [Hufsiella arboris]
MTQQIIDQIIDVIREYYPDIQEYDFEIYPGNKSLKKLTEVCQYHESNQESWLRFKGQLLIKFFGISLIENTLLIGNEPSYRVSIVFEKKKFAYFLLQLSVIVNCYNLVLVDPGSLTHQEIADIKNDIEMLVAEYSPGFMHIENPYSYKLNDIVVPNNHDSLYVPSIGDFIFSLRTLL